MYDSRRPVRRGGGPGGYGGYYGKVRAVDDYDDCDDAYDFDDRVQTEDGEGEEGADARRSLLDGGARVSSGEGPVVKKKNKLGASLSLPKPIKDVTKRRNADELLAAESELLAAFEISDDDDEGERC